MLSTLIQGLYRILAVLVVLIPISINLLTNSDVVISLLYLPLGCLFLSILFIYLDHQLQRLLQSLSTQLATSERKTPTKAYISQQKWCCLTTG